LSNRARIIKDEDHLSGIVREIRRARYQRINVGILGKEDRKSDDGPSLIDIGRANEFGVTINRTSSKGKRFRIVIPERSFLRSTADDPVTRKTIFKKASRLLFRGAKAKAVLDGIGLAFAAKIRDKIRSNIPPANADSTAARKGSKRTLIDTGRLKNAIAHEVK